MWTSIQQVVLVIQQVACEKINGCNKMSCFQLEGKELTQNSQGFLFNYLLKGLQRRVLFQACCQKELCERLECLRGMARYSSGGASVVHGSCCAALGSMHPLGIYRQLL